MNTSEIQNIINKNKNDIAFIIGNGINRYSNNNDDLSWEHLLINLNKKISNEAVKTIPAGISLTEFYDILEIENTYNINLKKEVKNYLSKWIGHKHHKIITQKIFDLDAPILTTNFDEIFLESLNLKWFKTENIGFTDFYPWSTYLGKNQLEVPTDGFGIWNINGMIKYHRSIRLGISHYMGSVERARGLLHNGIEDKIFSGKNEKNWKGYKTWLHIIFNKSLFVFGLGLKENEVFLRWLLIERKKYFKKFPYRSKLGWFVDLKSNLEKEQGKKFFLEKVGFTIIEIDNYSDIYEGIWN